MSCAHVASQGKPLPDDWRQLIGPSPAPFAALYRLTCCGRGTMLAALKGNEERLGVSITAPPGANVMNAWMTTTLSSVSWAGKSCRQTLPAGVLPLGNELSLPLDPRSVAYLLAGCLPVDIHEANTNLGLVEGKIGSLRLRATVASSPLHLSRIELGRTAEDVGSVSIELSEHHGRIPGKLVIRSSSKRVELVLVSWQGADPPPEPSWLALPPCENEP